MALIDDLRAEVVTTFSQLWTETQGRQVPTAEQVRLGDNSATALNDAVVLYADLDGSTNMVDNHNWQFSAEIYKAFLHCAAKIIRSENGVITAYDGDRVMAVFHGGNDTNTRAVRCGLKINCAVTTVIQPALDAQYPGSNFKLRHAVGIDKSSLRAARTGVRGDNDLVWVGSAANHAAKLTAISMVYSTWVTGAVYESMHASVKYTNGQAMWMRHSWTNMDNQEIWGSTWLWSIA